MKRLHQKGLGLTLPTLGFAALPFILLTAVAGPAYADVLTLTNGKVLKGITEEPADDPASVIYIGTYGRQKLPRTRIRTIEKETLAQGHINIGRDHLAAKNHAEALKSFQTALTLEPTNQTAAKMMNETQAGIAANDKADRQQAVSQIDDLTRQARELIAQGSYDKAEGLLKQANDMVPSSGQASQLRLVISDLYVAWAHDRQDKLDKIGAEKYLNMAIEANPDNEKAIEQILALWENDPEKREQSARVYESILARHPTDAALRKQLGDLYSDMGRTEDMVHHYLELYKQSDTYQGTPLEEKLIAGLDRLHNEYARKKSYAEAIKTYQLLSAISDDVDPTAVNTYQYLLTTSQLPVEAENPQAWLQATQFAEKSGMDEEAIGKYRSLTKYEATRAQAQAGLNRYAAKALGLAQLQYQNRNFGLAMTLADQTRKDFAESTEVVKAASELIGKAQAEQAQVQQQNRDLAKEVLRTADEFYAKANFHFNNLFSTERTNNPILLSDKEEAKKYYMLAINAYQEVIRMDPATGSQTNSLVNVKLQDCRERLSSLNQGPYGGFRIHRRDLTPERSLAPMPR